MLPLNIPRKRCPKIFPENVAPDHVEEPPRISLGTSGITEDTLEHLEVTKNILGYSPKYLGVHQRILKYPSFRVFWAHQRILGTTEHLIYGTPNYLGYPRYSSVAPENILDTLTNLVVSQNILGLPQKILRYTRISWVPPEHLGFYPPRMSWSSPVSLGIPPE